MTKKEVGKFLNNNANLILSTCLTATFTFIGYKLGCVKGWVDGYSDCLKMAADIIRKG